VRAAAPSDGAQLVVITLAGEAYALPIAEVVVDEVAQASTVDGEQLEPVPMTQSDFLPRSLDPERLFADLALDLA
jgi:chemotaxis signal transduction protein